MGKRSILCLWIECVNSIQFQTIVRWSAQKKISNAKITHLHNNTIQSDRGRKQTLGLPFAYYTFSAFWHFWREWKHLDGKSRLCFSLLALSFSLFRYFACDAVIEITFARHNFPQTSVLFVFAKLPSELFLGNALVLNCFCNQRASLLQRGQ